MDAFVIPMFPARQHHPQTAIGRLAAIRDGDYPQWIDSLFSVAVFSLASVHRNGMGGVNRMKVQENTQRDMGYRIAKRRTELGMSQEKLAESIGVNRNTVMRIENGEHIPRADRIAAVCEKKLYLLRGLKCHAKVILAFYQIVWNNT